MALLKISEPNEKESKTNNKPKKVAIGIDLGTTNSIVASVIDDKPQCIADENGSFLIPSVVNYNKDNIIVGNNALKIEANDAKNTLSSVKRLLGKNLKDIDIKYLPYDFIENSQLIEINTIQGKKNPIEVSAQILKYLKELAEKKLGQPINDAVITVPAYFDDSQRQATKDSAIMAGLNVLRLINEPTAAALAYGIDNNSQGLFLIYDLGGGTFDISILELSEGLFKVKAVGGNSSLGGNDFDEKLANYIIKKYNLNLNESNEQKLLLKTARKIKEELTINDQVIKEFNIKTIKIILEITLEEFELVTQELSQKTIKIIDKLLQETKINKEKISGIIMVGGSTRMKIIQKQTKEYFKKDLLNNLDPDKVVALGAAMQADILVGNKNKDDWLLVDIIPLSLGIETYGGLVEKIIPRNSTIPIAKAQEFTTFKDGQTTMMFHVLQGERELVEHCRSLAKFTLKNIPPMTAGAARIKVTFKVDADGLLSVEAKEETTNVTANIEVKPSYGIDEKTISNMLLDSIENAEEDIINRSINEAKVEALSLIESIESALKQDKDLLNEEELKLIESAIINLQKAIEKNNNANKIRNLTHELNHKTDSFAQRRMDRLIKQALQGKNIDNI